MYLASGFQQLDVSSSVVCRVLFVVVFSLLFAVASCCELVGGCCSLLFVVVCCFSKAVLVRRAV